ncbi:MAG TPA: M24 family metallopeptidase, partial [Nitrolancea sp.]
MTVSPGDFAQRLKEQVLPLRAQMDVRNSWLRQRLDLVIPELMEREGIDMWIVACREYNEDPVILSLLPQPVMSARRRMVLVFSRRDDGSVERLVVGRYGLGDFYTAAWNPEQEEQESALARVIRERNPRAIGINVAEEFAFGDGLSHNEYQWLASSLGESLMDRTTSAERLAVGWLERRVAPELAVYPSIVALGHQIIAEAFSRNVIQPGITTTEDVVWWMRQTMQDAGLAAWFPPTIDIQAQGDLPSMPGMHGTSRTTILPGDMLHCDVGFIYLGLATDQQQLAYVLKPGETDAPEGLKAGLAAGNRFQDIHLEQMKLGRSGNDVLHAVLDQATSEGIKPSLYTHPLGFHGHAAGPVIGLWDHQEG